MPQGEDDAGAASPQVKELQEKLDSISKETEGFKKATQAEREKRQALELQLAEMRGKLDANTEGERRKQERDYTRAQLRDAVEQGQLTQDESDAIWERQTETKLENRLSSRLEERLKSERQGSWIQSEIDRYKTAIPDLMTPGSEDRTAIEREVGFQQQLMGQEKVTLQTELAALRARYGPSENLQQGRKPPPESHEEGGSGAEEEDTKRTDGIPKGLTKREREYYQDKINKGLYKGWDDVEKEFKYADQGLRKRVQARS